MLDLEHISQQQYVALLQKKAIFYQTIRSYFAKNNVMEVMTPVLANHTVTDSNIHSISCELVKSKQLQYLQTSPEYAMKRLLALGVGSIYQICPAFRDDEKTAIHNHEFSMLEWYRLNFDYKMLMDDLCALLKVLNPSLSVQRISYAEVFKKYLDINPHHVDLPLLERTLQHYCGNIDNIHGVAGHLDALFSLVVQEKIKSIDALIIYDFPVSQASLAKISNDDIAVAESFELFLSGIEIGNGFTELTDAKEQLARFQQDNYTRELQGLPTIAIDQDFIDALEQGLPSCAGIAVGLDRLFMCCYNLSNILPMLL